MKYVYFLHSLYGTGQGGFNRALADNAVHTLDVDASNMGIRQIELAFTESIVKQFQNVTSTLHLPVLLGVIDEGNRFFDWRTLITLGPILTGSDSREEAFKQLISSQDESEKYILNGNGAYFVVHGHINPAELKECDIFYQKAEFTEFVSNTLEMDKSEVFPSTLIAVEDNGDGFAALWRIRSPQGSEKTLRADSEYAMERYISDYEV
tara:strand:- start:877 stop:1500 length:624 start_codon:yes stop_codon:yes gene_type:complete